MVKRKFLVLGGILVFGLTLFGIFIFLNQGRLILQIPFRNFTSPWGIEDKGFISSSADGKTFNLLSLPSCRAVEDLYGGEGAPIVKYILESETDSFEKFLYQPVKVKGTVQVESKTLKPPEIVCIKAPCAVTITERTMSVRRIEVDNSSLSSCQKTYLEELSKRAPVIPDPTLVGEKIPAEIPEEEKCLNDTDCGINTCECRSLNKKYLDPEGKICQRECPGEPICYKNRCIFKGEEDKYRLQIKP